MNQLPGKPTIKEILVNNFLLFKTYKPINFFNFFLLNKKKHLKKIFFLAMNKKFTKKLLLFIFFLIVLYYSLSNWLRNYTYLAPKSAHHPIQSANMPHLHICIYVCMYKHTNKKPTIVSWRYRDTNAGMRGSERQSKQ